MHHRLRFRFSSVRLLLLPFSAALVALALSGCATRSKPIAEPEPIPKPKTNELRQALPVIKFESAKSSKQIAECIVDKWQYIPSDGELTSRQTAKGYTIIQNANSGGVPAFTSDINDIPTGTETIFKAYPPIGNGSSHYQDAVKECQ